MSNFSLLASLGWQSFFQQQLSLDEWENASPARVIEQHRSEVTLSNESEIFNIELSHSMPNMVVGDWLLLDKNKQFIRLLERKTCFQRKAPGSKVKSQLISANVDTAFIVCSMNEDFNLNRIERFLALVNESGAEPVIVLSKSDQSISPESYISRTQKLDSGLIVEPVNCLDPHSVSKLDVWLKQGSTISVLGSSGVGKSTLINTLSGENVQSTGRIREDDGKGRHTTTRRSLIPLDTGSLILDTPGMREIQLSDCKEGIATTFADIENLSNQCRYGDCQHQLEPGCAVQQAIVNGVLDQRRLDNYHKLLREEDLNSASLMEKRAKDKALGKFYKRTLNESKKLKGR
ncbi:ribosome small subunit-dependent GTPase A [Alkalimarinus coralli]|uniref:ribosome small subunit-dependent GTPase A n=1 Tax=Alkalimarinus coralli TaxID=2935863 RepID=UPI00202BA152|nr:ribosome small subunit-dependent GTPase A [Alkalimarinus coralli]